MAVHRDSIPVDTRGRTDAIDLTERVEAIVLKSGIRNGLTCVFTPSSTSAIITNEFEPGLMEEDIPKALDRLFPSSIEYGHEGRWHDGNGHSHVRATFLGPSLTIPVIDGRVELGTWQQIVFLELDNKPRHREIIVQIVGEGATGDAAVARRQDSRDWSSATPQRSSVDLASDSWHVGNPNASRVAAVGDRLGRGFALPCDPVPRGLHQTSLARRMRLARRIRSLGRRIGRHPGSVESASAHRKKGAQDDPNARP